MVRGAFLLLASAVLAGCRTVPTWDFRAVPARSEQDWGDRLHLERPGVRVLVGPASAFPYTRAGSAGDGAGGGGRGRYQLFTRIMVENTGTAPLDVIWSGAYLEAEDGERIALVESRQIGPEADGDGDGAPGGAAAASELVERVDPGHRTVRSLLPRSVSEIEFGEPMIPLCDGCEYRLVLPVRAGGVEEHLVLPFRLERRERPGARRRFGLGGGA